MLVHFVATCLFINAFRCFSYLTNTRLHDAMQMSSNDYDRFLRTYNYSPGQIMMYTECVMISWFLGLLVAFPISLFISIRKKWFWLNSLIPSLLIYLFWNYPKIIFLLPRTFLKHTSNQTTIFFFTNGLMFLSLGIVVFFNKRIGRFICKGNSRKQNTQQMKES